MPRLAHGSLACALLLHLAGSAKHRGDGEQIILGIDSGYRSLGYALAAADPQTRKITKVFKLGLSETVPTGEKEVRKTSDALERARVHAAMIKALRAETPIDFVAAEMAATTPHFYPTFAFGVGIGLLAWIDQPIVQVLPYEAKLVAVGDKRATKAQIIAWALALPASGDLAWPISTRPNAMGLTYNGRVVAISAEHPADALAVIQAALANEQFRLSRALASRT